MRLFWLAGALCLAVACPVQAGGFSVMPTRVQLGGDRGVQSVVLTNTSAQTVTVESQVLVWPDGAAEQQSSDVIISPAVATLPPGQRVRLRIGLLRPGKGLKEHAYRIYFTELPAPAALQNAGIGVRLRVGIPVFVAPLQAEPQALRWTWAADSPALEVHNPGNVHARLQAPTVDDVGRPVVLDSASLYVLAGTRLRIPLPPGWQPAVGSRLRWRDGDDEREGTLALP